MAAAGQPGCEYEFHGDELEFGWQASGSADGVPPPPFPPPTTHGHAGGMVRFLAGAGRPNLVQYARFSMPVSVAANFSLVWCQASASTHSSSSVCRRRVNTGIAGTCRAVAPVCVGAHGQAAAWRGSRSTACVVGGSTACVVGGARVQGGLDRACSGARRYGGSHRRRLLGKGTPPRDGGPRPALFLCVRGVYLSGDFCCCFCCCFGGVIS